MSEIYFSIDIETSGPIIAEHSLLAIGACRCDNIEVKFAREVMPISNSANDDAMTVVGKPLEYFRNNGVRPIEAFRSFKSWVMENTINLRPVFVGFNAAFDWGFVNWYFLKYTDNNPFGIAPLDIKAYYAGFSGSTWEQTRSSVIPNQYKSKTEHTHDALEDAIEQAQMFNRIRAAAESRAITHE